MKTCEKIKAPISLMEAVKSGKRILFYNPNDDDECYCELDEFFTMLGNIYTPEGLADYLKKDEFFIED